MSLPTEAEIDDAIARIALSPDGRLLYRRLQMVLMSICPHIEDGALQRLEGRRTFARELKSLMDRELEKVLPTRDRHEHDPEHAAVVRPGRPVDGNGRASGRRVQPYDSEPS